MTQKLRFDDLLSKMGTQFQEIRRKADLQQKVVAKATGLNIGLIEAGKINITLCSFDKLCNYYEISCEKFFEDMDL